MALNIIFLTIIITIIAVWLIIEIKKLRHKIFAIILIVLILISYLSFSIISNQEKLNLRSFEGFIDASKMYFTWVGSIFGNIKTITMNAIKMDWGSTENFVNKTIS